MIVRVRDKNGRIVMADVRGPTGARFAAWKSGRAERYRERFAIGQVDPHDGQAREERRLMRNARKREAA